MFATSETQLTGKSIYFRVKEDSQIEKWSGLGVIYRNLSSDELNNRRFNWSTK